jgi:GTPase SAR1 family protein
MEHISEFESGDRSNRVENFYDFAKKFYQKRSSKKVLIIGPPSSGKTSIKRVFFEGNDSDDLLKNSLEPTRGFSHYVYNWLDMELGVADSSGQELNYYLSEKKSFEQEIAFESADVVIYNFDYPYWEDYSDLVLDNIKRVVEVADYYNPSCKIFAFCHKSDLIPSSHSATIIKEIGSKIKSQYQVHTFFTTIQPEQIASLYKAMQSILGEVSRLSTQLENILSGVIGTSDKTIALVLNRDQSIINQYCSTNYNFTIGMIMKEYYYKANEYLNKIHNNRIDTATIIGTEVLNIYIKSLSFIHKDVDSIVLVSESLSKVDLIRCATEIGQELKLLKNQQESIMLYETT